MNRGCWRNSLVKKVTGNANQGLYIAPYIVAARQANKWKVCYEAVRCTPAPAQFGKFLEEYFYRYSGTLPAAFTGWMNTIWNINSFQKQAEAAIFYYVCSHCCWANLPAAVTGASYAILPQYRLEIWRYKDEDFCNINSFQIQAQPAIVVTCTFIVVQSLLPGRSRVGLGKEEEDWKISSRWERPSKEIGSKWRSFTWFS